jgi:hypothetical protein
MTNPRDKYAVDRAAEKQGAVVRVDDMEFTVRSCGESNRGFRYAMGLAANRRRSELQAADETTAYDIHESLMIQAFADCVVLGWKNVSNGDGHELPFNREECVRLLEDCPKVWGIIRDAAHDEERFRPLAVKEDGEQLGKS